MKRILFIMLPLLLLAACAPATSGSSARQPAELGRGVIEVHPGETLYVRSVHTLSELGFNDGDLEGVLFVNETAQRASGRAEPWLDVKPLRVPAWWNVGLSAGRFVREMSVTGDRTTVQVVIRIDVPQNAQLGQNDLRLEVEGRRKSAVVQVPLRVRQR